MVAEDFHPDPSAQELARLCRALESYIFNMEHHAGKHPSSMYPCWRIAKDLGDILDNKEVWG